MTAIKAFIAGCAGPRLDPEEAAFFREAQPWGFILFRRNVDTPDQVRRLTDALRESVGRADAPVLVDQEGGRVQRLGPPHWPAYPPAAIFGRLPANDFLLRREMARLAARLMAHDLRAVGITVDCMPVLDVPVPGADSVIGDRAYGRDAREVAVLGRAAAEGLLAGGVLPVIKHVPGHGRGNADSHHALPVVEASREELAASDFLPFRVLADMPLAMSAHIVYRALDPRRPATVSRRVIAEVIRGEIGFSGLLMSDDISMNALAGTIGERARAASRAGCDIVLHCNGKLDEMKAVAEAVPTLSGAARVRAAAALARLGHEPEPFDVGEGRERLKSVLAMAGAGAET
ncbi:beta-N-acetylhexosaminidase [Chelatococcus composti]|uniref:beta-N-acetylhexosaminidase n=1 Tax=Chelatococcus composti TaxID=1743235 RepID=A0A841K5M9_9HYPH|nr:beta-N-acetylhexosaminidase [Chelatococcus composti]MBB6166782.1 beta-N-acetylhexosaminidase [Chelatococcus composti]MBS7734292.1 beta-N-acetylhexosaminidase [Chelatococcus composti]GGG25813.1 beta-hexosaminidase [Chelatococcus composti]